nr:hypothetical protein [Tanacetum cinerariifolium]
MCKDDKFRVMRVMLLGVRHIETRVIQNTGNDTAKIIQCNNYEGIDPSYLDYNELPTAQASFMANLSDYGSDVLSRSTSGSTYISLYFNSLVPSKLIENPSCSTPNVSPSKKDWDILCFNPCLMNTISSSSSIVSHILLDAALLPADTTDTPSSATNNQDAPSNIQSGALQHFTSTNENPSSVNIKQHYESYDGGDGVWANPRYPVYNKNPTKPFPANNVHPSLPPRLLPPQTKPSLSNLTPPHKTPKATLAILYHPIRSNVEDKNSRVGMKRLGGHSNLMAMMTLRSKQPFILEESPLDTRADQRTTAELLRASTEGYAEATVVPPILAEHFKLKHNLINMMTSDQLFGLEKENPHDHIRWFNKITSTIKYKDDRYKDLLRACPYHGFTELHQLDTFYNALNPADQDSLNSTAGGNLLERRTQDVLTIIENKSKVRNSRNKSIVSQVKSSDGNSSSSEIAKLTHPVNQQTSVVTTAMTAILKKFQATPPSAFVKAVEEICVTCDGAHPYYQCLAADGNTFPEFQDNIQGYVSAATVNYNQGNFDYHPSSVANQIQPSGSQPQGYNRGNNFNQDTSYQAPIQQNQVVPLRPLPSNTIANPKGKLKAIIARSGLVLNGPFVPMPPPFINPEEDERV